MFAANAGRNGSSVRVESDRSRKATEHVEGQTLMHGHGFANSSLKDRDQDSVSSWSPIQEDDVSPYIPEFIGASTIEEDSIYCKNEQTLVAYFGPLPREVEDALNKTDFYTQPMVAKIDLDVEFGMVTSQKKCYIWAVQKNTTYRSPPVCHMLPMPPNSLTSLEASVLLPVVTFTKSDDEHCGIMACSPDGTCWYWSNIDLCFSNVNQHVDAKIPLTKDDYVTHVECAGPMGYFFGTKFANVYHVAIKKQHGSTVISPIQLSTKMGGAIASIFSMIGMAPATDTTQKITSLTSGPKLQDPHGRWDLFAMTRKSLFKWQLHRSGDCSIEAEVPLKEQVTERILRDFSATLPPGSDPRVRLLDIEYIKNGKILILITFFATALKTATTPLSCALLTLSSQYGTTYDIEHVNYIQRTIEEDLRPEASPRLVVPQGGPGVFIITPTAVIISTTLPNFEFEDLVPLKTDRIIGHGCEDWRQRGHEMGGASELSIVCRSSGRLGIHIQVDGASPASQQGTGKEVMTAQLQAKLEQGVFYGVKKHNPISFDLSHYDGGDLNEASLNVSREILNSRASLLSAGNDLTSRLAERYQRTKGIINCIQEADMGTRLSIDIRFQLCWNTEKLAAAHAFWIRYQSLLADSRDTAAKANLKQVVQEAAALSLQRIGVHVPTDPITFLLKYHAGEMSELLSNLQKCTSKLNNAPPGQQTALMQDVNKMLILALRAAWNYRRQNVGSYALEGASSLEPWTATVDIIKGLAAQYDKTLAACKAVSDDTTAMDVDGQDQRTKLSDSDAELRDQLYELADVTLQAYSEHILFLESLPQSSENNIAIAKAVAEYEETKSRTLLPLVSMKMTQKALQLAQRYKDYETLVKISAGQDKQIDSFIAKYQQEFANALFRQYLDNNQVPKLLEQGEKYSDLFTVFLDTHDYSEIAWLQDIKNRRFMKASSRVQDAALQETNMDRRRTMLSLSKLLCMAGLPGDGLEKEQIMKYMSGNNDELEMATIQSLVADEWERKVGSFASVQDKAKAVVDSFGSQLLKRQPQLRKAILKSVESLLNRQTIGSEDLLDVLILYGSRDIGNFDVCDVALEICLHAADIPESRRPYVLQDIWRRIYIAEHSDLAHWKIEEVTDPEARQKLLTTWMARAYTLIYRAEGQKDDLLLRPEDTKCRMPKELFVERFMALHEGRKADEVETSCQAMMHDYSLENEELENRLEKWQLTQKWTRIKTLVKADETIAATAASSVFAPQDIEMEDV